MTSVELLEKFCNRFGFESEFMKTESSVVCRISATAKNGDVFRFASAECPDEESAARSAVAFITANPDIRGLAGFDIASSSAELELKLEIMGECLSER